MNKIKLFISQPMRGLTNEQIEAKRKQLIAIYLKKMGKKKDEIEVIDSFFKDVPHDAKPVWFLGESLKKLSEADVALFADGWEHARGCIIEHEVCAAYGIACYEEVSPAFKEVVE